MDYYSIYYHELRTITIEYNSENRPSEFEDKAVLEYRNLHNDLLALKKAFPKLDEGLQKLETDIPKLEEDIAILETELKKMRALSRLYRRRM
jgi:phage shock protein A